MGHVWTVPGNMHVIFEVRIALTVLELLAVADLGEGQGAAAPPPLARKVAQNGPLWALYSK